MELQAQLKEKASIPLLHLLHRGRLGGGERLPEARFTSDDVYKAIADGELVFDLKRDLLSEIHRVMVYRDPAAMALCRNLEEGNAGRTGLLARRDASIEVGAKVDYDGRTYTVVRAGQETATLQNEQGSFDISLSALVQLSIRGSIPNALSAWVSRKGLPSSVSNTTAIPWRVRARFSGGIAPMPLTAVVTRAEPGENPIKLSDEKGLYLWIAPSGGKWWRLKYRFEGKGKDAMASCA